MTAALDITTAQRKILLALLRQFIPGAVVWAYGSRVKWTARPNSDLDLVVFTTPAQKPLVSELKDALAESDLPFPVDIHIWDEIPERFHAIIRNEFVVLQDAEEKRLRTDLPEKWKFQSLREAGVSLIDCDHRTPPAAETGYPYIAIPQLKHGHIDITNVRRITHEHFLEWTRKANPQENDVILSRRCNPGETALVPAGLKCALGQNLVLLRADGSKIFPPFLRWILRGSDWWEQIGKFLNVGAIFDSLKCADIPNFRLPIPPLAEQRAIAAVLGALDDKIELNRRMNKTLETQAQTIFKSWFVDATATKLPKGWREMPFTDTVEILGGGTPKTSISEYWNGDIPWFSVVDAPQGSDVFVINTEKKITQAGVDNSSTRVLPVGTTIISARGTVGKIALVGVPMAMNQSCYGLRGKAGAKGFHTYFATQALVSTLLQHAHGSIFSTITQDTLAGVQVIEPPAAIVDEFEEKVAPMMERIRENLFESRTLAALRDALLPKLLSGELRVKEDYA
jgi:type I restriction enzyme S subunit